jgi:hypothetical protein
VLLADVQIDLAEEGTSCCCFFKWEGAEEEATSTKQGGRTKGEIRTSACACARKTQKERKIKENESWDLKRTKADPPYTNSQTELHGNLAPYFFNGASFLAPTLFRSFTPPEIILAHLAPPPEATKVYFRERAEYFESRPESKHPAVPVSRAPQPDCAYRSNIPLGE